MHLEPGTLLNIYDGAFFLQKTLALCFKTLSKSSPPEVFLRKGVLEICSKFTGKSPYGLCNFIKITLRHRCFPVNLLHIFRKHFYEHTYGGLLLFGIFPEKCWVISQWLKLDNGRSFWNWVSNEFLQQIYKQRNLLKWFDIYRKFYSVKTQIFNA